MDWQDEEFEAFLRQFHPDRPRPLQTRRRLAIPLAAAAVLLLGVAVSVLVSRGGADADGPQSTLTPVQSDTERTNTPDNVVQDGQGLVSQPQGVSPPLDALQETPALEFRPPPAFSGSLDRDQAFQSPVASTQRDGRVRVGGAIKPPLKVYDVAPVYPAEAQAAGVQGTVILDITIGHDGSVIEAVVVRSVPLLDEAARDAVGWWLFEPTVLNGELVEVEMYVTVRFTLS